MPPRAVRPDRLRAAASSRSRGRLVPLVGSVGVLGLVAVLSACQRPHPGADHPSDLTGGVFVDYSQPVRVGRLPGLDIPNHAMWEPLPVVLGDGWERPTRSGWHPYGGRSRLLYDAWRNPGSRPGWLSLEVRLLPDVDPVPRLTVEVDGVVVGSEGLVPGGKIYRFELPEDVDVVAGSAVPIDLRFDPPLTRVGRPEVTLVGFGLGDRDVAERPLERPMPVTVDDSTQTVHLGGEGSWVARLDPEAATGVTIELHCTGDLRSVDVEILDRSGVTRAEGDIDLEACHEDWIERRLEVDGDLPMWATLAVEVLTGEAPAGVDLRRLRYGEPVAGSAQGREASAEDAPTSRAGVSGAGEAARWDAGEGWPDVVVMLLDAARADHFGVYGYERDTTPQIDRMAGESLVFENAFSECPNTSCSVPNLITGVPFMNLGTVFHGRKLPDEVMTLAEYLKPLGYHTIGLSANPNNSVSRNMNQGFDYFERLWGAHRQADLAAEKIAAQPADEPLYLQLHILPPHQPYKPEPEFDVFTDPDYRGPVRPKIGLRKYTAGVVTFTPADLEQLIALYDGNLRMGDDAVGRVIAALKAAGRWERTLFVVTADHGEAFGEHGDFQHNSTLFDEMLHVPLVMRFPGGEAPAGVDTGRSVALADVVPTILGYLGLLPRAEVWGIDLLKRQPEGFPERFLYHRTAHRERPLLAIRGPRFKLITGMGVRSPMLFDRQHDPREERNLSAARPRLYAGLAVRLRDFVADWEERVPQSVEDVELTPEEVELLHSLGYVE